MLQLGPLHPQVDGRGLVVLELGLRQGDVVFLGDPGGIAIFGVHQDLVKIVDDVVLDALLLIQDAQLEIALGQGGLGAEAGIFQIGGARLAVALADSTLRRTSPQMSSSQLRLKFSR